MMNEELPSQFQQQQQVVSEGKDEKKRQGLDEDEGLILSSHSMIQDDSTPVLQPKHMF